MEMVALPALDPLELMLQMLKEKERVKSLLGADQASFSSLYGKNFSFNLLSFIVKQSE